MDFINSLNEVKKNSGNFKKWEQDKKNKVAQRDELQTRKQPTEEELAKAKALGENIINVIDIMDNHSESVAENVETATQPIAAFAPMAVGVPTLIAYGYFGVKPNSMKIKEEWNKIAKEENAKELAEKLEQYYKEHNIHDKYVWKGRFQNKNFVDKIEDPEIKQKAQEILKKYQKAVKPYKRNLWLGGIGTAAAFLASFVGAQLWTTKLQVDSSKIARYQARQALEDPKHFVDYTPEQIAEAKEYLAQHPELKKGDKKKEKLKQGFFKSIWNVLKDRRAYKKAKAADTDDSKIVTRPLSQEELEQAQRDRDVIQRTIKHINNEAEFYSENMEVAANVIIGGTPILGAVIGGLTGFVIKKLGLSEKFVKKYVENNASDKTKKLFEEMNAVKTKKMVFNAKWLNFFSSLREDGIKAIESKNPKTEINGEKAAEAAKGKFGKGFKMSSGSGKDLMSMLKRDLAGVLAHTKGAGWVASAIGFIVTGTAGAFIGLKLQKSASRAGRFTAKRELENNPANFIGYTDKEYDEVKDVKNTKPEESKAKQYIMFLPRVLKQFFAYEKYKKGEYKENKALHDILIQQNVSDKQLKDAKNLQRKLFNTFEKVDDNSQTYSESMEAATEMAQPFIVYGTYGLMAAPFIAIGAGIARGKITMAKVIDKVTKMLAKSSKITKSKLFKKYANEVEQNISVKVAKAEVTSKPLAAILEGVNLKDDSIVKIMEKLYKNIGGSPEKLRQADKNEISRKIADLRCDIHNMAGKGDNTFSELAKFVGKDGTGNKNELLERIDRVLGRLEYADNEARIDLLDMMVNWKSVEKMPKDRFKKSMELLRSLVVDTSKSNESWYERYEKLNFLFEDGFQEKLSGIIGKVTTVSESAKASLAALESVTKKLAGKSDEELVKLFEKYKGKTLGDVPEIKELAEKLNNNFAALPEKHNITPYIKSICSKKIPAADSKGIKLFRKTLKSLDNSEFAEIKNVLTNLREFKLSDAYNLSKKAVKASDLDFGSRIDKYAETLKNMSDDEFRKSIQWLPHRFRSIDKKTMENIVPRIKTIIDNIPKEEIENIMNTLVKEFNEHPDEFIKCVKDGSIYEVFKTPMIKKALIAAGVTWSAFTIGMAYLLEQWFADMQLKAGRLGVMKALDSLEDPRYYANVEETKMSA